MMYEWGGLRIVEQHDDTAVSQQLLEGFPVFAFIHDQFLEVWLIKKGVKFDDDLFIVEEGKREVPLFVFLEIILDDR